MLKYGVAALITLINISVQRLVGQGLERYRPLVTFNRNLIWVSMGCDVMIIGLMSLPNRYAQNFAEIPPDSKYPNLYLRRAHSFHPVAYTIKLAIEMALGDLIVKISSAKPAKAQFDPNFEGLKIAVSTHTTTTAVRFEDVGDVDDNEKMVDGIRKTRTPARPDLSIRLEKIRQNRKARKAAEQDGLPQRRGSDARSDDDDDVKIDMEMEESANWENSIHHLPAHGTYSPASGSGSFVDEKL
ncbi:hypothetical protein JCM5350_003222 [Sporobolomyces pararoseus]